MTREEMIKVAEENVSRLENKDFGLYFYVLDTKGNPTSALEYIYQTALALKNLGYNVTMLHDEDDFEGVGDWMGEEYANLPHANIKKENVTISASDFLFIPEIFANVMMQTTKLPCKRVIIVQNANNITEFMPVSQSFEGLGITDAIVTTEEQGLKLDDWFGTLKTHVVNPSIRSFYAPGTEPRKLLINIVAKDQTVINRIVKPFYWKNPIYKFVSFRDLRGMSQETFATALKEAAITIWVDDDTQFGHTLLEAIKCGGLVFAKVPTNPTEWMINEEGGIVDGPIWFETLDDLAEVLPSAIRSWTLDQIPDDAYKYNDFLNKYTEDAQREQVKKVYVDEIIGKRLADFKEVLTDLNNGKDINGD
jgi:hypothetical protein